MNAPDKHKYHFEADFYDYLNRLVQELQSRIQKGKSRLNIQEDDKVNPRISVRGVCCVLSD